MKQRKSSNTVLVFNATTLIVLRELGIEHIIEEITGKNIAEIIIPEAVRKEFQKAGTTITIQDTYKPTKPSNNTIIQTIPTTLGEGEQEAITIAHTINKTKPNTTAIVVTDDKKARKTCIQHHIKVIGTLGIIELAKKNNIISKNRALKLLDQIPQTSLYITQELLEKAKQKIEKQ